jgi:hypothetical protein
MMKNEPFFAQFDANQERDFFWTIIPFGKSTQQGVTYGAALASLTEGKWSHCHDVS